MLKQFHKILEENQELCTYVFLWVITSFLLQLWAISYDSKTFYAF